MLSEMDQLDGDLLFTAASIVPAGGHQKLIEFKFQTQ